MVVTYTLRWFISKNTVGISSIQQTDCFCHLTTQEEFKCIYWQEQEGFSLLPTPHAIMWILVNWLCIPQYSHCKTGCPWPGVCEHVHMCISLSEELAGFLGSKSQSEWNSILLAACYQWHILGLGTGTSLLYISIKDLRFADDVNSGRYINLLEDRKVFQRNLHR